MIRYYYDRWDKLTPDERRKEQEAAYRQQVYSNS